MVESEREREIEKEIRRERETEREWRARDHVSACTLPLPLLMSDLGPSKWHEKITTRLNPVVYFIRYMAQGVP